MDRIEKTERAGPLDWHYLALRWDKFETFANLTRLIPFNISALFFTGWSNDRPQLHCARLLGGSSACTASAGVGQNDRKFGVHVFAACGLIDPILTETGTVRLN